MILLEDVSFDFKHSLPQAHLLIFLRREWRKIWSESTMSSFGLIGQILVDH